MLKCSNCGIEQSEGKFCGSCGGALVEDSSEQEEVVASGEKADNEQSSNEPVEQQQSATTQERPTQATEHVQQAAQTEAEVTASQAPLVTNGTTEQIINQSKIYGEYFFC